MFVTLLVRFVMLVVFAVTCEFVAYSSEPFTASVLLADSWPAATLVMVRSLPALPTLTVLAGVTPANLYAVPPIVAPVVAVAPEPAFEPAPRATELSPDATALVPNAMELVPEDQALSPSA